MTSFDFDISEQELAGAQNITAASRRLIAAFVAKCRSEKLTKAKLAERLGLNKSQVSRLLRGDANMTLRTEGELYWAMGYEPYERHGSKSQVFLRNSHKGGEWVAMSGKAPVVVMAKTAPKLAFQ